VIAIGGVKEVTAATHGDRAIGVISANPAYLMNDSIKGQAVALKGRVPVLVQGAVNKGDRLISTQNLGVAQSAHSIEEYYNVFAISLENNSNVQTKLVECIIL
jgi:hypothetical protein